MEGLLYALVPVGALVIDTIFGDPRSRWHPVVLIGNLISFYENRLYPKRRATYQTLLFRGGLTVVLVLLTVGVIVGSILSLAEAVSSYAYLFLSAVVLYFTITPRALARDGTEIYKFLRRGKVELARQKLSWIVGRDTDNLDESEISRGTIETIAENTTDGIISPLFYFLLFGPVGAAVYRAANTMDSMLGYKNHRYLFFGRVAARFDDVLNYIPARLTYVLFVVVAYLLGYDGKKARRIGLRDAKKHPSPNGGYAEATVAGALHIRLGGYNYYDGEPEFRAYMGDADRAIVGDDIRKTLRLMYGATILCILVESLILWSF